MPCPLHSSTCRRCTVRQRARRAPQPPVPRRLHAGTTRAPNTTPLRHAPPSHVPSSPYLLAARALSSHPASDLPAGPAPSAQNALPQSSAHPAAQGRVPPLGVPYATPTPKVNATRAYMHPVRQRPTRRQTRVRRYYTPMARVRARSTPRAPSPSFVSATT